jgi:cell division protein FtsW
VKTATTTLVSCVGALLALGMVVLYSAKMTQSGTHYLAMQLVWAVIGLVAGFAAASMDYRKLREFAAPLLGFSVLLLLLVLIPHVGMKINGARRWFDLKVMRFQPSELAKLALVLALAVYAERNQRQMSKFKHGLMIPALVIGTVLGLILLEPDFGNTILLAGVSVVMLIVAGMSWRYLIPPVLAGVAGISYLIVHDPVRLTRILAWLNPEAYKDGVGYQPWQAMLALGSGGWTGDGLGNGRQKLGFVPEHHTDFILSVIGEELGLAACACVIVGFIVILICGVRIAMRARDTFGQLLATGLTFLICFQAFINIGVVTSVLPNKGLPLPFISYGGSNLLMMLICVGLLVGVARQITEAPVIEFKPVRDNPFAPAPTS